MNKTAKKLIEQAQDYGLTPSLPPKDAYELLQQDNACVLIDVRTKAELDWVGRPQISSNQYKHIEWLFYPGSAQNPQFLQILNTIPKDTTLLFLCRSGVRSKMAVQVAVDNGFVNAIDVLGGFEGQRNHDSHRKSIDGWCYAKLPWIGA